MVKYRITKGKHYVYNYANKSWYRFNDMHEAFGFMRKVIGG